MTKMLRILTVDDEPLALRRLKLILQDMPGIVQVGEATGCESAVAAIKRLTPDIILLDIRMRDGTGFDVIEALPTKAPAVIFVSAFDSYAMRAFNASVADYVLKPVEFDRLRTAIERAARRIAEAGAAEQVAELKAVIANLRAGMTGADGQRFETELWVRRSAGGFTRVPVEAVEWVSSEDDYIRVHTSSGSHLLRGSIKRFESRVDPAQFMRIHRKALVRTDAIRELRKPRFGNLQVVLRGGEELPAGRIYARQLRELIAAKAS
jgi:two-component system LytT family response regulator